MSEKIKKNAENINDQSEKVVGGLCGFDIEPNTINVTYTDEVTYNVHCSKCHTVLSTFTQARRAATCNIDHMFCPQCNSYQNVYAKEAN